MTVKLRKVFFRCIFARRSIRASKIVMWSKFWCCICEGGNRVKIERFARCSSDQWGHGSTTLRGFTGNPLFYLIECIPIIITYRQACTEKTWLRLLFICADLNRRTWFTCCGCARAYTRLALTISVHSSKWKSFLSTTWVCNIHGYVTWFSTRMLPGIWRS